ncbi:MAG: hypothetical protein J6V90_08520 [Treponema sp.]|nr:hypothetical protein [Treponema sp.]
MPAKIKPLCANCFYCVHDVERPVPRFFRKPIFYPGLFCGNKIYEKVDYVFGNTAMPWCEEINDKGQCPSFEIRPAIPPETIAWDKDAETVEIESTDKPYYSVDGENFVEYTGPFHASEGTQVSAYCVFGTKIVDGEEVENKSDTIVFVCEDYNDDDGNNGGEPAGDGEAGENNGTDQGGESGDGDTSSTGSGTEGEGSENAQGGGEGGEGGQGVPEP